MRKLLIATTNEGKFKEIKHFLSDQQFELISLSDLNEKIIAPEENADTIEGNSILKAKYYSQKTGYLTIADDSGLFVDALGGWPGVDSALIGKVHGEGKKVLLEKMMDVEESKRSATFRVAISLCDPETETLYVTSAHLEGSILKEAVYEGDIRWGFNEIFQVDKLGNAYGQLTISEKNEVSHRGKALNKMKYILENNYRAKHIVVPVGLLIKDGKILMTKRNDPHRPEYHGKWEFPGGSMEIGETFEQNVIREVKEEAGYDVEIISRITHLAVETQTYPNFTYQVYLVPFVCRILGGDGVFSDTETLEARWFDLDDTLNYPMIGENERMYRIFLPELKEIINKHNL